MKLTADTITDQEVRELMRRVSKTAGIGASDKVFLICNAALNAPMGSLRRVQARAECADIVNAQIADAANEAAGFDATGVGGWCITHRRWLCENGKQGL